MKIAQLNSTNLYHLQGMSPYCLGFFCGIGIRNARDYILVCCAFLGIVHASKMVAYGDCLEVKR